MFCVKEAFCQKSEEVKNDVTQKKKCEIIKEDCNVIILQNHRSFILFLVSNLYLWYEILCSYVALQYQVLRILWDITTS